MKMNKISAIFIIAVMALAGIGISYAGFTERLDIFGTVQTATVEFQIEEYSGTWVWKIWGCPSAPDNEIVVTRDPDFDPTIEYPGCSAQLISWAEAGPYNGDDYDVLFEFENLFPCIDFIADIKFTIGTIPVKVNDIFYEPLQGFEWMGSLIEFGDIYATMKDQDGNIIEFGDQLHPGDIITVELHIHIPQDNMYQGRSGAGHARLEIIQWTDECGEPELMDISIDKTVDNENPYVGQQVTYTVTATNNGPGDATGVQVSDLLINELVYYSHMTTHGDYYDDSGLWDIGALDAGEIATLEITATVDLLVSAEGFIQLAMILDGSGSINQGDWTIMLEGLAAAIENFFPHNSMVELTVVQFAGYSASQEIGPIVIDEANYQTIADNIRLISKRGGTTPLACGLNLASDLMYNSIEYDEAHRQVINIVTDGVPNVDASGTNGYSGTYVGEAAGEDAAEIARDNMITQLGMTHSDPPVFGEDEIDAEAVGTGPDVEWLRTEIVWPEEGTTTWPPTKPGWVREVDDFQEFADTIGEKFVLIFDTLENCATLIASEPDDFDPFNNQDCVVISPLPCPVPEFTNLDLETSTDTSTWEDVTGDLQTGFELELDPLEDYHYLTLGDATTTNVALLEDLHPFLLDTSSVPIDFYSYWESRGVYDGCPGTWEPTMWEIIDGNQPMFYVKAMPGDSYMLVDGLLYQTGQGEQYLRINGEYPTGSYTFYGTILSICGSESEQINVDITFTNPGQP